MKLLKEKFKKLLKIKLLLTYDDLSSLNLLLKIDIDIKKAFLIIENSKNREIIKTILKNMEKGNAAEEIFIKYLPSSYSKYLSCFINYLPLSKSLDLTQNLINKEKEFKNKIIKELSYPCLLMVVCFLGIYLFNFYFFDTFYNLIKSFKIDAQQLFFYRKITNIVINVLFFMTIVMLFIFLTVRKNNRKIFYFLIFNKIFKRNIFKIILTQEFIIYYRQCLIQGLKTKEIFEIFSNLKHKLFIRFLSFHIDKRLLEAKSYLDALDLEFLDERLKKFIKIAFYTDQNKELLQVYIENTEKILLRKIKMFGIKIQIFAYLLCGFVVYFIYQLLLMPLGIIERM